MSRAVGPEWPYCETPESLESDGRRRTVLVEIAGVVLTVAGAIATWQGLEWYAVATMSAA